MGRCNMRYLDVHGTRGCDESVPHAVFHCVMAGCWRPSCSATLGSHGPLGRTSQAQLHAFENICSWFNLLDLPVKAGVILYVLLSGDSR